MPLERAAFFFPGFVVQRFDSMIEHRENPLSRNGQSAKSLLADVEASP